MPSIMRTALDPSEKRIIARTLVASVILFVVVFAWIYGPLAWAYWSYEPKEGDLFFQSLSRSMLAKMMEGTTESQYSNCGIIAKLDGQWVVYEAHEKVRATPLLEAIFRGNRYGFAIYRLRPDKQEYIEPMLDYVKKQLDKPFDVQYHMDDEKFYSSELIYKAYREASGGETLGKLVPLGQLRWKPFEKTIRFFERGPVPLRREWITPKNLSQAEQLEKILVFRIEANQPYIATTSEEPNAKTKMEPKTQESAPVIIE
jgi:hypothetical protein